MSCFIVSNQTLANVVAEVRETGSDAPAVLSELCEPPAKKSLLGNQLYLMNCAAFKARYGEEDLPPVTPLDEWPAPSKCPYERLKSIRCLLYQCAEGDIPETWVEYAALEAVAGDLAYSIVRETEQYEAAKGWE